MYEPGTLREMFFLTVGLLERLPVTNGFPGKLFAAEMEL
jgi:hypothetical protein